MTVAPGRKGEDKYRQRYFNPSLAKHLLNKATIYSIQNEKILGALNRIPQYSVKLTRKHRARVGSWQLNEFSQLQITYDNRNLLWLGSCLVHSSESYQVVDLKLAPLSTPTLLYRDQGKSSKVFATDVSSWKIISPIFTATEEPTGRASRFSETLGRMRNEARRIRNELMLQPSFGHMRKTRLFSNQHLKTPVAVSHKLPTRSGTGYTRGSG